MLKSTPIMCETRRKKNTDNEESNEEEDDYFQTSKSDCLYNQTTRRFSSRA